MFDTTLSFRHVIRGLIFMLLVMVSGTLWFTLVEGFTVLDAVYMTVITVSTVGFREVGGDLDASGKIFVLFLITSGLAVLTYTLGSLGRFIVEGSIERYVGRRRMVREIGNMSGHYIVAGHGRMGEILCEELARENVPFVVIEGDPDTAEQLARKGYRVVEGDATEDEVLGRAGVARARSLVAVVSNNVDNLYITLSAREMCRGVNDKLYILARATDDAASEKIKRAGADRVISPYVIGGMRIVQALLRPTVYDFMDIATQGGGMELMFEELPIGDGSNLDGVALRDSGIRADYDIIVIAVKKPSGRMVFNPGPGQELAKGDVLITLGDREQLDRLRGALA
ncbi:potassium channel protein [bacterium]|nr:potassium channel protein [bacterium]